MAPSHRHQHHHHWRLDSFALLNCLLIHTAFQQLISFFHAHFLLFFFDLTLCPCPHFLSSCLHLDFLCASQPSPPPSPGASISPETMMHFPPCLRFPPYFRNFLDFLENF